MLHASCGYCENRRIKSSEKNIFLVSAEAKQKKKTRKVDFVCREFSQFSAKKRRKFSSRKNRYLE